MFWISLFDEIGLYLLKQYIYDNINILIWQTEMVLININECFTRIICTFYIE